ncbi:MAG TPA: AI-2E family transporter [Methylomirabilota bacterium]|nr:AI-2E family transporter [Methylomirabilota bacterium]
MVTPAGRPLAPGALNPVLRFVGFVLVLGSIYWAQAVLIPLALAMLITFLLTPAVAALQRRGVPRVVAVVGTVLVALTVVAGVGAVLGMQVMSLAEELPRYSDNIRQKIADVRSMGRDTGLKRAKETVERAASEAERQVERETPQTGPKPAAPKATPVIIERDRTKGLTDLPNTVSPWLEPLSRAGLVVLLVPFMLLAREELRNRFIRLVGFRRLAITTRAMDEAGARVTRYLLTQSGVNASFAALVAVGLWLIGVPYAVLFGVLAGALRFVPYIGIWIGAGLPVAVTLAVFPGWTKALLVVGLFLVLEIFTSAVLEVLLYARSAGVSEVGLLVALAFWTWAWGPLGLLLATPLTVCLVVIAKYVPELQFMWVVMGDEPVVSPEIAVYQRLLAGDEDEASDIVERHMAARPGEAVYDDVLLPSLVLASEDHATGRLGAEERRAVIEAVRDIAREVAPEPQDGTPAASARVLGVPARSDADEAALAMVAHLLAARGVELDVTSPELLSAEVVRAASERGAGVVVVGALPPGGLVHARYLVKRLRAVVPEAKIVVGRWGVREDVETVRESLTSAGADAVGGSLLETRDRVAELARLDTTRRAA